MESRYDYEGPLCYPLLAKVLLAEAIAASKDLNLLDRMMRASKPDEVVDQIGARLESSAASNWSDEEDVQPIANIRCAAICFDSKGEVHLAKRSPGKNIHPGKWEFVCSQLRYGDTLAAAVMCGFLTDFVIHVDLSRWPDSIPVATYSVRTTQSHVCGVIVVAEYSVIDDIKINTAKHADAKWVDSTHLAPDTNASRVPKLNEHREQPQFPERVTRLIAAA